MTFTNDVINNTFNFIVGNKQHKMWIIYSRLSFIMFNYCIFNLWHLSKDIKFVEYVTDLGWNVTILWSHFIDRTRAGARQRNLWAPQCCWSSRRKDRKFPKRSRKDFHCSVLRVIVSLCKYVAIIVLSIGHIYFSALLYPRFSALSTILV